MSIQRPKFFDSPYFVPEDENWHLKDDAPEDVRKEFEEYKEYEKELEKRGIIT